MLICHCEVVDDRTIRNAIAAGADSVEAIGAMCGAGRRCGGCIPALVDLLRESTTEHDARPAAA